MRARDFREPIETYHRHRYLGIHYQELLQSSESVPGQPKRRAPLLPKAETPDAWMTVEEVADYLRLSNSKVYEMAQRGEMPCSKEASRWRFHRAEIDAWMFKQRTAAGEQQDSREGSGREENGGNS